MIGSSTRLAQGPIGAIFRLHIANGGVARAEGIPHIVTETRGVPAADGGPSQAPAPGIEAGRWSV